jgi:hypothetical protein
MAGFSIKSLSVNYTQGGVPATEDGSLSIFRVGSKIETPMKILALEKEIPNVTSEQFAPHLKAEAARV